MRKLICLFIIGVAASMPHWPAQAQEQSIATTPQRQLRDAEWWMNRYDRQAEQMKKGGIDLLMIGDSITHSWEGQPELWNHYFHGAATLNLGTSGDRTEHVLWRLQNLPFESITPQAAMIMIGTNNVGHNISTPREAAEGIRAIVDLLRQRCPSMKIFVLYVFPRDENADGDFRSQTREINSYLPELLKDRDNVVLVDFTKRFLEPDGKISPDIMPDFLHLSAKGYRIWGDAVQPFIEPLFQKSAGQNDASKQ